MLFYTVFLPKITFTGIKMTLFAFFLIIFSAAMHASWNLVAKRSAMTVAFYTIICMTAAILWLHVQFWTPLDLWDLPCKFYIMMAASVFSDTFLYCFGLMRAYRTMEMSTAYPMMRSLPLLLTAALTAVLGWGKPLTWLAIAGMVVVFAGCITIPQKDFKSFKLANYFDRKMFFILLVACGTTGYTVFDSQAMAVLRGVYPDIAKVHISLGYYSLRAITLTSTLLLTVFIIPSERRNFIKIFRSCDKMPFLAGGFASLTYATVLLAMNYVDNVSYVQVFRQLGLIFALAGGIFFLKEKCTAPKLAGTLMIVAGLIMTVL